MNWPVVLDKNFIATVRIRLNHVPIERRQTWDLDNLYVWWFMASTEDPYLNRLTQQSDKWSQVKSLCADLIGPQATYREVATLTQVR
ncbi:MAG: hypothetical protein HKM02_06050 [Pseudomonadales bacterium]|nr:hypothetical protein [Pseudomonadales bacterium]